MCRTPIPIQFIKCACKNTILCKYPAAAGLEKHTYYRVVHGSRIPLLHARCGGKWDASLLHRLLKLCRESYWRFGARARAFHTLHAHFNNCSNVRLVFSSQVHCPKSARRKQSDNTAHTQITLSTCPMTLSKTENLVRTYIFTENRKNVVI